MKGNILIYFQRIYKFQFINFNILYFMEKEK